jgi:hypothetical protein
MFDQKASKLKLYVCIQTLFYIHNHNGMIKTKIKKAIAIASIAVLTATTLGSTFAANIGTTSINGTGT